MRFLHLVGVHFELLFDNISNTFLVDPNVQCHFSLWPLRIPTNSVRMILRFRGVSAVIGLPDRGRSSRSPNSRNREIARETVRWSMLSWWTMSQIRFPLKWSSIIAARWLWLFITFPKINGLK
jgi:hypothetical protein